MLRNSVLQLRLRGVWLVIIFLFGTLLCRLFYLQVIVHEKYIEQARNQYNAATKLPAQRGDILIHDYKSKKLFQLAMDTTFDLVYIDPQEVAEPALVAKRLAPVLNLTEEEIYERAIQKERNNVLLSINVSPNKLQQIDDLKLSGVTIEEYELKKYQDVYIGPTNSKIAYQQRGSVYIDPTAAYDVEVSVPLLAGILNVDENIVQRSFNKRKIRYVALQRKLLPEQSVQIKEMNLKGVVLVPEHWRYYPEEKLASNLMGFVNKDGEGQYGLEGQFEEVLHGKDGVAYVDRDLRGRQIATGTKNLVAPEDGEDFILTLDRLIQRKAESVLQTYVDKHEAESGQLIVMEPVTGKILAIASYPDYNPNEYYKVFSRDEETGELVNKIGAAAFDNPAVSGTYEPGSVMKAVTMAAALDAGVVTPWTEFEDDGDIVVGPYTIKNSNDLAYGLVNMTNVLESSLNTGAAYVGIQMGPRMFHNYMKAFGFGKKTGIGLEVENSGDLPPLNQWSKAAFLTSTFGQGFTATPLQMLNAINTVVNGGLLMRPYVLENFMEPKIVRRVISEQAASQARSMMVSVVENGQAKKARVAGFNVGGKTGTSQVPNENGPGYSEDLYIASFAGFGPVEDPKFSLLVKVNYPQDVIFGSVVAAPAFAEMSAFLLDYFEIEPRQED